MTNRRGRSAFFATGFVVILWNALADAFAPALCCLCRKPRGTLPWLCDACAAGLAPISGAVCLRCGAARPLPAPVCPSCPDWPVTLIAARAGAAHTGAGRDLVHALKFGRELAAARPLGSLVASAARLLPLPDGIRVVPVPLARRRRIQRGFNQATEIARIAARDLRLELDPRLLRRVRWEGPLVVRSPAGRRRAVAGAYRAPPRVGDVPVLLVDDVCTTGATLGACARALHRRGVRRIWAVTATRALTP